MAPSTAPRRSRRLLAKGKSAAARITKPSKSTSRSTFPPPVTGAKQFSPRSRNTSSSAASVDQDLIDSKLAATSTITKRKQNIKINTKTSAAHCIDDSASSSDCDTDFESSDEEDSDDEYDESTDLSADNFEWSATDSLDTTRISSYDSRFESGNEDYEMNGFVVGDDEDIDEWDDRERDEGQSDIYKEFIDIQRHPGYIIETRRASYGLASSISISLSTPNSRRSCEESKLFYLDPNDTSDPLAPAYWSELNLGIIEASIKEEPLVAEENEDVLEEITDAITLFSRRCNKAREPIRLRLAAGVLDDHEIKEALDNAVKLGYGRKLSLEDGSKRWTIGLKGT